MDLFAKQFSLFLLFVSLLSSHARESQYFNKAPAATTTNDVVSNIRKPEPNPQQQEQPAFLPDNENRHGLSGQDFSRLPNTPAELKTEPHWPLPRNNNPVPYVTEPDEITERDIFPDGRESFAAVNTEVKKKNFDGGAQNYFITPEQKDPVYRNNYYDGGSQAYGGRREQKPIYGGFDVNRNRPQGMSDTRNLENGKYYYDIEAEKYNSNHPYQSLKRSSERNGYGVNGENGYGFNGRKNAIGGYQNQQYEFQDDNINNWRP